MWRWSDIILANGVEVVLYHIGQWRGGGSISYWTMMWRWSDIILANGVEVVLYHIGQWRGDV